MVDYTKFSRLKILVTQLKEEQWYSATYGAEKLIDNDSLKGE